MTDAKTQSSGHPEGTAPAPGRVGLLTCSMANDLDLFALLAASIDRHAAPGVLHQVVVPGSDLRAFRQFETENRTIIAQEDILPEPIRKLPRWLKHLSFLKAGFRRPIYLRPNLAVVRGWMLQQILKIEMTRQNDADAVMHIDSDVCFFRRFDHADGFRDGKVRYFRVTGPTANPMHMPWLNGSAKFLGLDQAPDDQAHYIENCVMWSRDVTRAMVDRLEATQGKPLHEVLFSAETMSEYYLYGVYADAFAQESNLAVDPVSFCNSYWPADEQGPVDFDALRARLDPKHCAMAVQSTHNLDITARAALYKRAETDLALS
ncbi:MAG: DUF6492 family protein [Paracoccaceae bacterium]